MRDNTPRLALLMKEAGLLSDKHWRQYARALEGKPLPSQQMQKSLLEILNQSAFSPETYREFFFYPIKLPFGAAAPSDDKPATALEQTLNISPDELLAVLTANEPPISLLADLLRGIGVQPSPVQLAAIAEAETLGRQGYAAIVQRGMFTPEHLDRLVRAGAHPYWAPNRVQLAADILALNGLCPLDAFLDAMSESQESGQPVGETLAKRGALSGDQLLARLREGLELPSVELRKTRVAPRVTGLFPGSFVRHHLFLPLKRSKTALTVAMSDPLFISLCDALSILTGLVVIPLYAPQHELLDQLRALYPDQEREAPAAASQAASPATGESRQSAPVKSGAAPPPATAPQIAPAIALPGLAASDSSRVDNLSTVQIVSRIIEDAIASRATDIHIEPHPDGLRVRYRIDGALRPMVTLPSEMLLAVSSRVKVLADMNVTERRRPQDGRFSLELDQARFDFRISTLPTRLGEKVVVRILDQRNVNKGMGELGMTAAQQRTISSWIAKPYGMILVTGPTGSGKSTTLYACLNTLNGAERNIVTIEDPVEYQLAGVNQVQVDPNIELTFADGLRAVLRQDPDVIMVGEIRDQETARIAARAALTGHLVLSTLHTNSAFGAVAGLEQVGLKPYVIASALLGVVAQRLLRTLCPSCKTRRRASAAVLRDLGIEDGAKRWLSAAKGCDKCFGTGYAGRTGVFEFFAIDDAARALILRQAGEADLRQAARRAGLAMLLDSALEKLFAGLTTTDEVVKTVLLA